MNIGTKKDSIDIKSLFSKEEEQEIYENASPNSKRRIVKYYTILKIAGQFDSRNIDAFLKQFFIVMYFYQRLTKFWKIIYNYKDLKSIL